MDYIDLRRFHTITPILWRRKPMSFIKWRDWNITLGLQTPSLTLSTTSHEMVRHFILLQSARGGQGRMNQVTEIPVLKRKKSCLKGAGMGWDLKELISALILVKEGRCPYFPFNNHMDCSDPCKSDNDCPGAEKCCGSMCGFVCAVPWTGEDWDIPPEACWAEAVMLSPRLTLEVFWESLLFWCPINIFMSPSWSWETIVLFFKDYPEWYHSPFFPMKTYLSWVSLQWPTRWQYWHIYTKTKTKTA